MTGATEDMFASNSWPRMKKKWQSDVQTVSQEHALAELRCLLRRAEGRTLPGGPVQRLSKKPAACVPEPVDTESNAERRARDRLRKKKLNNAMTPKQKAEFLARRRKQNAKLKATRSMEHAALVNAAGAARQRRFKFNKRATKAMTARTPMKSMKK